MPSVSVFKSTQITVEGPKVRLDIPIFATSPEALHMLGEEDHHAPEAAQGLSLSPMTLWLLTGAVQYSWLPDVLRLKGSVRS